MKKIIIALCILTVMIAAVYFYKNTSTQTLYVTAQKPLSEKTILVWDLHQVLFQRPSFSMFTRALPSIQNKPRFIKQWTQAFFDTKVRMHIKKLKKEHITVSEAYFDALKNKYPHAYAQSIILANALYVPNKKLFDFIQTLQKKGYKNYIFSNIGPTTLAALQKQYPIYFSYFTNLTNTINPTTPENALWIDKPKKAAYLKMLHAIGMSKTPERVIFIDDRIKNIKKAHKLGINGILYTSDKQTIQNCTTLLGI